MSQSIGVRVLLLVSLLALTTAPVRAGGLLYDNPPALPGTIPDFWTSSYVDSGGDYFWSFSNFQISQTSVVTGFEWQGGYYDYVNTSNNPATPNTASWLVGVYTTSNSGGYLLPDAAVTTEYPLAASVTATLAGYTTLDGATIPYYDYTYSLTAPVILQVGQTYAFTVFSFATAASSPTEVWTWAGSAASPYGYTIQYYDGGYNIQSGDRTFAVYGQAVPEPSTLTSGMIATVLLGWFWEARCRRGASCRGRTGKRRSEPDFPNPLPSCRLHSH
ncbi:MAG: hypothetical protein ACLQGP_33945 [Isosphaeraceae bacterium]